MIRFDDLRETIGQLTRCAPSCPAREPFEIGGLNRPSALTVPRAADIGVTDASSIPLMFGLGFDAPLAANRESCTVRREVSRGCAECCTSNRLTGPQAAHPAAPARARWKRLSRAPRDNGSRSRRRRSDGDRWAVVLRPRRQRPTDTRASRRSADSHRHAERITFTCGTSSHRVTRSRTSSPSPVLPGVPDRPEGWSLPSRAGRACVTACFWSRARMATMPRHEQTAPGAALSYVGRAGPSLLRCSPADERVASSYACVAPTPGGDGTFCSDLVGARRAENPIGRPRALVRCSVGTRHRRAAPARRTTGHRMPSAGSQLPTRSAQCWTRPIRTRERGRHRAQKGEEEGETEQRQSQKIHE